MTTTIDINEHTDPRLERRLESHGITWQLQLIALDDIDWDASLEAQLRSEPFDPETVERYTEGLDAGDSFPAVLARPAPDDTPWSILGGIHRAKAYQAAGLDEIPAYTIGDVDDAQAELLALEDNARHGDHLDPAAQDRHALRLVLDHGHTHAEAARAVGTTKARVTREVARAKGTDRAKALGVMNGWTRLKPSGQSRLQGATSWNDDVFTEAVRTSWHLNLGAAEVFDLAAKIAAADRDVDLALLVIEDYELEHHRPAGGSGRGRRNDIAALRALAMNLLDLDVEAVVASCLPIDRDPTRDLIKRAASQLKTVHDRLTTGATP